jgi:hypothetical protein
MSDEGTAAEILGSSGVCALAPGRFPLPVATATEGVPNEP